MIFYYLQRGNGLMGKIFKSRHSLLGFLALTVLSALGNYFSAELFFELHFLFSSVFIFIIIHFYGTKPAVSAAAIAGIYTFFLRDNFYEMAILVLETWFVGYFYYKVKRNFILWDTVFLSVIAVPLTLLFSSIVMDMDWMNVSLIMLKQAVNMLLNVLVANALILLIGSFPSASNKRNVSLQEILFNLLLLFFLLPLVTLLVYIGKGEMDNVKKEIRNEIDGTASSLTVQMNNLYHGHLTPLVGVGDKMKYTENGLTKSIQNDLMFVQHSFPLFKVLYAIDQEGKIVARYSRYSLKNYRINPKQNDLQEIKEKGKPFLSDIPAESAVFSEPMITLTVPVEHNNSFRGYVLGAIKPMSFLQAIHNTAKEEMKVTFVDRDNKVIISNDSAQKVGQSLAHSKQEILYRFPSGLKKETELASIQQWMDSSYSRTIKLGEKIPWKIHISMPIEKYKNKVYEKYIWLLCVALFSSGMALVTSYLLSFWIQASLLTVANLTNNLPDKINSKEKIHWPDMMITEVASIIDNFKNTENKLHRMFSEIRRAQENMEYLAHFDPLTNVYNRSYFMKIFQELASSATENTKMAVFFIDLDRFKIVNDSLGHQAGDALLIEVSDRLKKICENECECVLSRLGGDEFIILMPAFQDSVLVEQKALEIIASLSTPYKTWENEYYLTASIGISLYPDDGIDSQTLIKYADMAMYAAKDKGKNNYQFYHSAIKDQVIAKVEMENELRHAMAQKQLHLFYQPQIDFQTGEITGVEALIRWIHPRLGFISPADFIPIAEETGMIIEIGDWILQTACQDAKAWQAAGWNSINISVNISMRQFLHENLMDSIKKSLQRSGLDPSYLKLEITESLAMSQPEQVVAKLYQLKELGIELALDDFGTGHSSLNYLKLLPVDILKIDRAFVKEIDQDDNDVAIVKALIEVAHSLGMTVIAEGVETVEQREKLKSIHCDQLQGFIFSKPLSGEALKELFEKHANPVPV